MSHESYSLFELNTFFRRIFALNLPDLIWVRCEIAQVNQSRGHYYLDLIEKGEGPQNIIARLDAVIWQKNLSEDFKKKRVRIELLVTRWYGGSIVC
jgi:exodeoxyribonuclease VII large subunit